MSRRGRAPQRVDVAIIGGGPAAAVLATRLVRDDVSVVVCRGPSRVSGSVELVSGRAVHLVSALTGTVPRGVAIAETVSSWESTAAVSWPAMLQPYGGGIAVERHDFDEDLLSASGATVGLGIVRRVDRSAARWLIDQDGARIRADRVAFATGRSRSVLPGSSKAITLSGEPGTAVAARVRVRAEDARAALMLERAPVGWWWSLPTLKGDLYVGRWWPGQFPVGGAALKAWWWADLSTTNLVGSHVVRDSPLPSVSVRAATAMSSAACVGDGWVAVGDAAFAPDPLSGQGIEFATASAMAASDVLLGRTPANQYEDWISAVVSAHRDERARHLAA